MINLLDFVITNIWYFAILVPLAILVYESVVPV